MMTKEMHRVFNFSGGRSSALMTILEYKHGDLVLFCDTGREHPKTYKFINDFEAFENIPVTKLNFVGGFEGMLDKNSKTLPNMFMRFCTTQLKIRLARMYLLSIGITECYNFIGFRHDEQMRIRKYQSKWIGYKSKFTLNELKIDKPQVIHFFKQRPYDLEIPSILGNCDLCFMKGQNAIISILKSYPHLADKWIADEKRSGRTYFKGISYEQLRNIAQNNLFREYDLNEIQPAFDCACTA